MPNVPAMQPDGADPRVIALGNAGLLRPADVIALQRLAGNATTTAWLRSQAGNIPAAPALQRWPTRAAADKKASEVMRGWLRQPDQGRAKYLAIQQPYEGLLKVLETLTTELGSTVAQPSRAGRIKFLAFLQTAFSSIRQACGALVLADNDLDLKGPVNFVFDSVTADEASVEWLFTREDPADLMWNMQFKDKTYQKCLRIAQFVGPLYASGYHTDRAFVEHGHVPRHAPKTGDKLHISADTLSFRLVRDQVLPFLATNGYTHKIVADDSDLKGSQRGKVVTIYPKLVKQEDELVVDQQDLARLADHLAQMCEALGILHGPAVAGDVSWNGSSTVFLEKDAMLRG
jgi:hypothetical protein